MFILLTYRNDEKDNVVKILFSIIRWIFGVRREADGARGVFEFFKRKHNKCVEVCKDKKQEEPKCVDKNQMYQGEDLDELFDKIEASAGKPCGEMTIKEIMEHLEKVK